MANLYPLITYTYYSLVFKVHLVHLEDRVLEVLKVYPVCLDERDQGYGLYIIIHTHEHNNNDYVHV